MKCPRPHPHIITRIQPLALVARVRSGSGLKASKHAYQGVKARGRERGAELGAAVRHFVVRDPKIIQRGDADDELLM